MRGWKEECDGGQDVVSIRVSSKESHLSFCANKRRKHSTLSDHGYGQDTSSADDQICTPHSGQPPIPNESSRGLV